MMPGGMSQGEGSANNQTGALGMNSLQIGPVGSPTMNRMETGGDPGLAERDREREREAGVTDNSEQGAAMHASAQNAANVFDDSCYSNGHRHNTGAELSWSSWELSCFRTAHTATRTK